MTLILSGTDGLSDVDGSAATPAIRGTDANTGIFFPAADTVGVSTGGSERVRVDSSGNVGIGTSSPLAKLQTNSTDGTIAIFRTTSGANNSRLNIDISDSAATAGFAVGGASTFPALTFANGGSERMRIDSSGNVGIGLTSYNLPLSVKADANGQNVQLNGRTGDDFGQIFFRNFGGANNLARIASDNNAGLIFGTGSQTAPTVPTERMRIDSGGIVYINTTTDNTAFLNINHEGTSRYAISCNNTNTGSNSQIAIRFNRGTSYTQVGTITTTNAATSYSSGSDYRLKDNVQPMTGALAKVALLKPVTFNWTIDGSDGQGFIAHELQEVCPDAVTGSKDAVDENGKPEYQGVDTSFLVATLTAAIQEQQALITALTARITALENK